MREERDLVLTSLEDALSDPDNVTNFLLLELEVGVESSIGTKAHEGEAVELDLIVDEGILEGLLIITISKSSIGEELTVSGVGLNNRTNLISIVSALETLQTFGVEETERGIELEALIALDLSTEGVEGNVD